MRFGVMRPMSRLATWRRNPLVAYGIAILLAAGAVIARELMTPLIADHLPFATYFLAVLASAVIGGWRPALLAWLLLAGLTWLTDVGHTFLDTRTRFFAFSLYSIVSLTVVSLVELSRVAALRLRRSEGRLAATLRASRMGTWSYAGKSGVFKGDAIFNRICGLPEDFGSVALDDYLALVVPEHRDLVAQHLFDVLGKGSDFDMEFRIRPPDGEAKWVYARGQLMGEDTGGAGEVFGVLADIDRRKRLEVETQRAEQARREAEALFRTAQEMSMDGFALLRALRDDDGRIVDFRWDYANPMAHNLLRKAPGSLIGRTLSETMPACYEHEIFTRFVQVVERGEAQDFEQHYLGDGVASHFHNKATKLGERVAVHFADISARKQEEAARAAILEGRKLLLQELNHRTKNSLQLIAALVQLQASRSGDALVQEHLEQVRQRIMTIAAIHTRLYRDSDKVELISLVDMAEYLAQLCGMLRSSLLDRSGRITLTLDAAPVKVHLDLAIPLGIIVNELVTNALKHAFPDDRAGCIAVTFGEVAGGWQLAVADDGVGAICAEAGSGTGMRMVQALARQVGGDLGELPDPGYGAAVFLPQEEFRQWQRPEGRRSAS